MVTAELVPLFVIDFYVQSDVLEQRKFHVL